MVTLNVNGVRREVQAPDDTPLLYVLRNDLQLIGPQFGCGLAQCGACAVLVDGKEVAFLRYAGRERCQPGDHHARRSAREVGQAKGPLGGGSEEHASPGAASLDRGADSAVRFLPERDDDQGHRTAREQSAIRHWRKSKRPSPHPGRRRTCAAAEPTWRSLKPYNMPPRSWRRGGKRWQP